MSDIKKFEEMLDRLVNEDKDGAQELFHEIVVEKSRDIYESLLEDDLDDEEVDEATDEEVDESDDEELDEDFNLDEFEVEADPMAAMGGDAGDDMMGDVEMPAPDADDHHADVGGEEELEDRVMDLEDALDDLKAEFDKMMSDEEGDDEGDEEGGDMDDMDDMGDMDDEAEDDDEAEEAVTFEAEEEEVEEGSKGSKSATEQMREYVEKVGGDNYKDFGKMGDNGANTKSTVASKNDMGGTASNLVSGGEAKEGNHAGLADINAKEENAGNVNVPGAKGATKMASTKGHGAEKKGAGETAANTKSITS